MPRRTLGQLPDEVAAALEGESVLRAEPDIHDEDHIAFALHHPALMKELDSLVEDLVDAYNAATIIDIPDEAIDTAWADPEHAPYPVRQLAHRWGLSPAQVMALALGGDGYVKGLLREGWWRVSVKETPTAYVIRIPRPITPGRKEAVQRWLKQRQSADQPEQARGVAGKKRYDRQPALLEALPWFERWNQEEERPAVIWRSLRTEHPKLTFEVFIAQLIRAWERMREISPEGVRPDRPSKAPA